MYGCTLYYLLHEWMVGKKILHKVTFTESSRSSELLNGPCVKLLLIMSKVKNELSVFNSNIISPKNVFNKRIRQFHIILDHYLYIQCAVI